MENNRYYLQTNTRRIQGTEEDGLEVFTSMPLDMFVAETVNIIDTALQVEDRINKDDSK
jgi:hypothetical protein